MPRFVSVNGQLYGVSCETDGTKPQDDVPSALRTSEIITKISFSQKKHKDQAAKRRG